MKKLSAFDVFILGWFFVFLGMFIIILEPLSYDESDDYSNVSKDDIIAIFSKYKDEKLYDADFKTTLNKRTIENYNDDLRYLINRFNSNTTEDRIKIKQIQDIWLPILKEHNDMTRLDILQSTLDYILGKSTKPKYSIEELKMIYYYLSKE